MTARNPTNPTCHTRTSSTSTGLSAGMASHDHIPAEFAVFPDLGARITDWDGLAAPHALPFRGLVLLGAILGGRGPSESLELF